MVCSLALAYRQLRVSGPYVVDNSEEKIDGRFGGLVFGHFENFDCESLDAFDANFLLIRKPESYVVSLARYVAQNIRHPLHSRFQKEGEDWLYRTIIGGSATSGFSFPAVDERYQTYLRIGKKSGAKVVDFDRLRNGLSASGPEAELLNWIGGENFRQRFEEVSKLARGASSTFKHSSRSPLQRRLPGHLVDDSRLERAALQYRRAICESN